MGKKTNAKCDIGTEQKYSEPQKEVDDQDTKQLKASYFATKLKLHKHHYEVLCYYHKFICLNT
jgi:hypothetical protein